MITLDGNAQRKTMQQRMVDLGLDEKDDDKQPASGAKLGDGDDLLDLMDSAK